MPSARSRPYCRKIPSSGRASTALSKASSGDRSAHELLRANPDQPELLLPGILAVVEERQQEPDRSGVEGVLARQVRARGWGPGGRPEVREAPGPGDGPEGAEPLAIETGEDVPRQLPYALEDERGVERIDLERLLLPDGLRLPLVRDRTVGDAPCLGLENLAPAAEPVDELERLDAAQVTDGANTPLVGQTLRLGTDARNDPDGQRTEELLGLRPPAGGTGQHPGLQNGHCQPGAGASRRIVWRASGSAALSPLRIGASQPRFVEQTSFLSPHDGAVKGAHSHMPDNPHVGPSPPK